MGRALRYIDIVELGGANPFGHALNLEESLVDLRSYANARACNQYAVEGRGGKYAMTQVTLSGPPAVFAAATKSSHAC